MKQSFEMYRALKGERNYWFYLLSNIFSRVGDSIDSIAYSWIAYELTGNAAWLAIIIGVNALPTIFITPLVAPVVEKMDKKRVMVVTNLLRAMMVVLTGALMLTGILTAPMLLAGTLLISISESFSDPAFMAAMPRILPMDKLDTGIALRSMVSQTAQLIGTGIAGIIIGVWGGGGALVVDGTLFFLSAMVLSLLSLNGISRATDENQVEVTGKNTYWADLKGGIGYFMKMPTLMLLCFLGIGINLLFSPLNQLMTAFVVDTLHLDAYALSVVGVASSIGMLIGSALYPIFKSKLTLSKTILLTGILVTVNYLAMIALGFVGERTALKYVTLFTANALFTLAVSFFSLMSSVLFFRVVEEGYLSRMASIFNAFSMAALPLGSIYCGTLVSFISISHIYLITAVLVIICTIVVIGLKSMKTLDDFVVSQRTGGTANETTV